MNWNRLLNVTTIVLWTATAGIWAWVFFVRDAPTLHPMIVAIQHGQCPPDYDHWRHTGGVEQCLYNPPERVK